MLGVVQRVGRGIALLFLDHGTRRGWGVSVTPRPFFTSIKTRYPLYRRLGGPQGRSGQVRYISPPPGFDLRTVQPIASCYTPGARLSQYHLINAMTVPQLLNDCIAWSITQFIIHKWPYYGRFAVRDTDSLAKHMNCMELISFQKPRFPRLLKALPEICGTRMLVAVFTKVPRKSIL